MKVTNSIKIANNRLAEIFADVITHGGKYLVSSDSIIIIPELTDVDNETISRFGRADKEADFILISGLSTGENSLVNVYHDNIDSMNAVIEAVDEEYIEAVDGIVNVECKSSAVIMRQFGECEDYTDICEFIEELCEPEMTEEERALYESPYPSNDHFEARHDEIMQSMHILERRH
jgi:hypothetical protein